MRRGKIVPKAKPPVFLNCGLRKCSSSSDKLHVRPQNINYMQLKQAINTD